MYTAYATLLRHSFKDRPDWIVVDESIPLGTTYRVIAFRPEGITIINLMTGDERDVPCYLVTRPGDTKPGYIPVDVFNE